MRSIAPRPYFSTALLTLGGSASPNSMEPTRPAWLSRVWWSVLGTKELHSHPGALYLAVLESGERLPNDGDVRPGLSTNGSRRRRSRADGPGNPADQTSPTQGSPTVGRSRRPMAA